MTRARGTCVVILLLSTLLAPSARLLATDGHILHGVGAINSGMGGAGVAAPKDLLGTVYLNPAGLLVFEETRVDLGFEMFKPGRTLASVFGPYSGSTTSKSEFVPIPAFGWSRKINDRFAVGLAGLGVGGFGVDYPVSPNNPILAPPPNGFGQLFSNYQLMKIAPVMAFKVNEKVSLGAALNVDWATLSVMPFPAASPAADPGPDGQPYTADDRAFYSDATATDGAFGFGVQVGMLAKMNDRIQVGASYTSPQFFKAFAWKSVYKNPNRQDFQMPREIAFKMNIPAIYAAGVGIMPNEKTTIAADFRYITYGSTEGFEQSGYDETGAVKGFGWENIKVIALGAEFKPKPAIALRAGYNYSDNPIPDDLSMFNVPAPGIVQHHVTLGFGFEPIRHVGVSLAYYHAFENTGSGPFVFPQGAIPGSRVTNSLKEDSILMQFSIGRW